MKSQEILVVIHLSANAIHTVIGQIFAPNDIRVIGISSVKVKHHDFYQGVIRHRERLKAAIKQSIQEAEDMANCRVMSVWLSFATPDLFSKNSMGQVRVEGGKVQAKDIVAALTDAKKHTVADNQYLMHYFQQGIALDDSQQTDSKVEMIDDAIGMSANDIMVLYHLMMMPVSGRQNLQLLLQECDVSIDQMIFDAVSSAEYGLLPEEKYHGICFIDIGAGTTSVCVYSENKLIYTHCFAEGGHDVTLDISYEMGITIADAEALKKNFASVDRNSIDASQFINIKRTAHNDEKMINAHELLAVTEARYFSILNNIKQALVAEGLFDYLHHGFVIAGGGAEMRGLVPFAKQVFGQKVSKVNLHPAISAYAIYEESDEKLKYMNTLIQAREYQTAFGTLLYSQSDAYRHSEKSSADNLKESRLQDKLQNFGRFLRRYF